MHCERPRSAGEKEPSDAMWVEIGLVVLLVLVNAGLSGSEMAFVSLRESQVNRLAEEEGERGRKLAALVQDPNTSVR
jgi:putative hemolysin